MTDYIYWCDFAPDTLVALARSTALDQRQSFTESSVTTNEPNFRKSTVLWRQHYAELDTQFVARLTALLPHIRAVLPMLPEAPTVELQMTSHGDGQYFKRHTDNGSPETSHRMVTFVYYFGLRDAPGFHGGELILEADDGCFIIEPRHNHILMFPAGWWHEVRPVSVPSGQWDDSRFTCNGWFLR
jgi:Rps23 Pro-64 3,4-dihydroxylase Tpa1-like proline 4-hydroxylase